MSTERTFLECIAQNPQDELLRAVYADFLLDHKEEEFARVVREMSPDVCFLNWTQSPGGEWDGRFDARGVPFLTVKRKWYSFLYCVVHGYGEDASEHIKDILARRFAGKPYERK